jgi:YHS domain-containing protein
MSEHRTVAPDEDPVCGMTVNVAQARQKGLVTMFDGHEFAFCGKGCFLDFRDDPESFLAPEFSPSM